MNKDIIWIASYDIGKRNFSFYIEEISIKELEIIKNIPKDKRYNPDGSCTLQFSDIMKKVYINGKIILLQNVDLTQDTDKSKYFDLEWCHNMIDILDKYKEYWDKVSYFIVEQQMSFGKKNNTMALKLGQNCESYFMFKYGRFKKVIEFPAYYKTQILGAKKNEKKLKSGKIKYVAIDKSDRKKWSIQKGLSILEERKDFDTIEELKKKIGRKKQKLDDKMDVLCQLQSFKYLYFVEKLKI